MGFFNSEKWNKKKEKKYPVISEVSNKNPLLNDGERQESSILVEENFTEAEKNLNKEIMDEGMGAKSFGLDGEIDVTQFVDFKGHKKGDSILKKSAVEPEVKKYVTKLYKPTIKEKLTIILIENTEEVVKEKETILKVVKNLVKSGYIYIINYGNIVKESQIEEVTKFDYSNLLYEGEARDKACLYDALLVLENVIFEKHNSVIETDQNKIHLTNTEIIGIGRCIDNCSAALKELAMSYFYDVASRDNVTSKYFCLTEDSFIDAATIGFRSIGSIYRKFN